VPSRLRPCLHPRRVGDLRRAARRLARRHRRDRQVRPRPDSRHRLPQPLRGHLGRLPARGARLADPGRRGPAHAVRELRRHRVVALAPAAPPRRRERL
ncbi:MAG: hypothetical protein AVDCRST_MAG17-712, partial [uncultured Solirubrobacterales bacterium]